MSGTIVRSATAAYVDATGIHAPSYADVLDYLITQFQVIYGTDIVVTPDSQDGQLIGIFALAIADANAACVAVYNSYSPSTAQGVGLSSAVKINGMQRLLPSYSTVELLIVGIAGTTIIGGQAIGDDQARWNLPSAVTIPPEGEISVTATAVDPGAVTALPGTINTIGTVTRGWQEVSNAAAAVPGAPVESDAALRLRQSNSTAMPALSVLEAISGSVMALPGVQHVKTYENDTGLVNADGVSPHSIALIVQGGDSQQICDTILKHKTPGCGTDGTTRHECLDVYGLPHDIGFYIPASVPIGVKISLTAKPGYSSLIGIAIQQAVVDYINGLGSGVDVVYSKLWLPANLCDAEGIPSGATNTYDITSIQIATPPSGTYSTTNIPIDINQIATCVISDVVLTVS